MTLFVTTRAGVLHSLEPELGLSVMEVIRDAGIDELLALCGGCCSCATCHIYIRDGGDVFPAMTADENDLLDASNHRNGTSRLSCQLIVTAGQPDLVMTIAPED